MDGGTGSIKRGEGRVARDYRHAHNSGGPLGLEADAHGKNYPGFSQRENAWLRGNRAEFCRSGRLCRRAPAGGGKRKKRREIFTGGGKSDIERAAGRARGYNRFARASSENSARRGSGCSVCRDDVFAIGGQGAKYSCGRGENRATQNVCGLRT